jgi:alanine racemase
LYEYRLEPEVFDVSLLQALQSEERETPLDIHIKVDTGMHRLGFKSTDAPALLKILHTQKSIRVASVFTHLAAAGNKDERDFTLGQIKEFNTFYETLAEGLGYRPMRHVLNTNGVLYFPEYQYEAVRLGIGLYGAGLPETIPQLQAVHTLKARISQIHEIASGTTVGYDRAFTAPRDMRLGTINIGYADGLRRCAGHLKYPVLVHGKRAAILGKVCMDMAMIDLTNHPEAQPGDEVIIFGPEHSVDELARVCDTIPYEILTGISQRVARVFLYS